MAKKKWKVDVTTEAGLRKAFRQLDSVLGQIIGRVNWMHDKLKPPKKKGSGGGTDPEPKWPPK
jgi:hypothetical protein